MRYKKAFTLIELLVVIAIIGVIIAIIAPAIGKAKAGALRAQCISNLRQVGIGFCLYLDDHDETFPPGGGSHAIGSFDSSWEEHLYDYIDDHKVFICKDRSRYGYNGYLGGGDETLGNKQKRLSEVPTPSRTILCVDSMRTGGTIVTADNCKDGTAISCRHSNGADILWVSGSVEWFPKSVLEANGNSTEWRGNGGWWGWE